ncbi:hypothetical protein [Lysobacter firmicutimachus]|uniref:Uncharacterized protein n=1 Tax=Lysobacter firmicutimachus TaxID=1792846 RepID=A0ABU8D7A7_9GAMM
MRKYLAGALILIAIFFAWVYWWAPTSTCDECDGSSAAVLTDAAGSYEQAARNGESEKQVYYSLVGALEGNKELERKYLASFKAMSPARQQGSIAAVERMPSSDRRDELLGKMRRQVDGR